MKKYRILQIGNRFYPQESRWFGWVYLDNLIASTTWSKRSRTQSLCETKEHAEKIINKRIKFLENAKHTIHEYKPQDK